MLSDTRRVSKYRAAIDALAKQADSALEIGCGPVCLLAINAARAGAKRVTALEVSRRSAAEASSYVRIYGFDQTIKVLPLFSKEADLAELAADARHEESADQCRVQAPASLPSPSPLVCMFRLVPPCGFSPFYVCRFPLRTIVSPNRVLLQSVGLRFAPLLLSDCFAPLEELNFEQHMRPQMLQKRKATFTCTRSGKLAGFVLCCHVDLMDGVFIDHRKGNEESHWYTNIAMLRDEVEVMEGDTVDVYSCADLQNYQGVDVPIGASLADAPETSARLARHAHEGVLPLLLELQRHQSNALTEAAAALTGGALVVRLLQQVRQHVAVSLVGGGLYPPLHAEQMPLQHLEASFESLEALDALLKASEEALTRLRLPVAAVGLPEVASVCSCLPEELAFDARQQLTLELLPILNILMKGAFAFREEDALAVALRGGHLRSVQQLRSRDCATTSTRKGAAVTTLVLRGIRPRSVREAMARGAH
ncbi:hypothetical protein cyc_01063 [Cyclospora cayetanensis]|uniref:Uncharacterized protein n=1 Tax=Cyclospora cayetanensis TaxID=88456 RepID=A0A1D3D7M2_9EIME|nr:hypothetical protein cyc_01063 [Cyclospora cayetanensis]